MRVQKVSRLFETSLDKLEELRLKIKRDITIQKENYMTDEQPSPTKEAYFSDVRKMAQFIIIDNKITTEKEWDNRTTAQRYHMIWDASKDEIWINNLPYIFCLLRFTTYENFNNGAAVGKEAFDKGKSLNNIIHRVGVGIFAMDIFDEITKVMNGD